VRRRCHHFDISTRGFPLDMAHTIGETSLSMPA
jgi:hypothetical protein